MRSTGERCRLDGAAAPAATASCAGRGVLASPSAPSVSNASEVDADTGRSQGSRPASTTATSTAAAIATRGQRARGAAPVERRVEDREQAALELRGTRHRERPGGPGARARAARELQQVVRVVGAARTRAQHQVVARPLALDAQPPGGDPGERVEPVDGAGHLRQGLGQAVVALDVAELVGEHRASLLDATSPRRPRAAPRRDAAGPRPSACSSGARAAGAPRAGARASRRCRAAARPSRGDENAPRRRPCAETRAVPTSRGAATSSAPASQRKPSSDLGSRPAPAWRSAAGSDTALAVSAARCFRAPASGRATGARGGLEAHDGRSGGQQRQLPARHGAAQGGHQESGRDTQRPDEVTGGGGGASESEGGEAREAEHECRLEDDVCDQGKGEHAHVQAPSWRALSIRRARRSRSSSESFAERSSSRAAIACSAEPSKNVRTT